MTHILSLDDGTDWIEIYRLILEPAGYNYTGTADEQEALAILRSQPVDLFTTDFHRPGLGGCEFLRLVKTDPALRHVPVLGISLWSRASRAEALARVGLDIDRDLVGYMEKSFTCAGLVAVVEAVLGEGDMHGSAGLEAQ